MSRESLPDFEIDVARLSNKHNASFSLPFYIKLLPIPGLQEWTRQNTPLLFVITSRDLWRSVGQFVGSGHVGVHAGLSGISAATRSGYFILGCMIASMTCTELGNQHTRSCGHQLLSAEWTFWWSRSLCSHYVPPGGSAAPDSFPDASASFSLMHLTIGN